MNRQQNCAGTDAFAVVFRVGGWGDSGWRSIPAAPPDLGGGPLQNFMGARGKAVSTEGLNVVVEWEGGGIELIPAAVIECIEVGT